MPRRNNLSEIEHTFRNIVPLLDATIGKIIVIGGSSLKATATRRTRRNKESDPNDRTRVGFKVDAVFGYQEISWTPVIGCMEVSGASHSVHVSRNGMILANWD
ncbi:hypothetical protein RclHR1_25930001 [Rhizophagus clarus]|uniref:Uncharacterized protein n=1 Tax=Rhizophagus clarus TaxID=94130 RepID=A0A2Z6R4B3_9GLOM|nr:hypothetical protein RclHR1_25930001 [Rhizophagus clarus]